MHIKILGLQNIEYYIYSYTRIITTCILVSFQQYILTYICISTCKYVEVLDLIYKYNQQEDNNTSRGINEAKSFAILKVYVIYQ